MHIPTLALLLSGAAAALASASITTTATTGSTTPTPTGEPVHFAPILLKSPKRQLKTCEQTYGAGSVQCGTEQSTMCYNPGKGETCCPDSGYCEQGLYCAPVAGYCCVEGQDLESCAAEAGFVLSSSPSNSNNNDTSSAAAAAAEIPLVATFQDGGSGATATATLARPDRSTVHVTATASATETAYEFGIDGDEITLLTLDTAAATGTATAVLYPAFNSSGGGNGTNGSTVLDNGFFQTATASREPRPLVWTVSVVGLVALAMILL